MQKPIKFILLTISGLILMFFPNFRTAQRHQTPVSSLSDSAVNTSSPAIAKASIIGLSLTNPAQASSPSGKHSLSLIQSQQVVTQYPISLEIPSISLNAPIVKTGLEADGSLHVPSNPTQTGWYDLGPKPGDVGPAVITGHYDSVEGPGVLYNLKHVKVGDEVDVVRDDGSIAVFKVDRLAWYLQNDFNTQAVYGSVNNAQLRIITCSGIYSKTTRHYSDDLVVYASLIDIREPGHYISK